jgi:hypothetical protein
MGSGLESDMCFQFRDQRLSYTNISSVLQDSSRHTCYDILTGEPCCQCLGAGSIAKSPRVTPQQANCPLYWFCFPPGVDAVAHSAALVPKLSVQRDFLSTLIEGEWLCLCLSTKPWRNTGEVEVKRHAFETSALNENEGSCTGRSPLKKEMPIPTPVRKCNLVVKWTVVQPTGMSRITKQRDYPNNGLALKQSNWFVLKCFTVHFMKAHNHSRRWINIWTWDSVDTQHMNILRLLTMHDPLACSVSELFLYEWIFEDMCWDSLHGVSDHRKASFTLDNITKRRRGNIIMTMHWGFELAIPMFQQSNTSHTTERESLMSITITVTTITHILQRLNHGHAVSRRLPTAAVRVRTHVRSYGICGSQSGTGASFLRVLRFPLTNFIPPTAPYPVLVQ